jgi:hypothetical protein
MSVHYQLVRPNFVNARIQLTTILQKVQGLRKKQRTPSNRDILQRVYIRSSCIHLSWSHYRVWH